MNKNIKTQERKRQRTWADSSQKKKQTFLKHLERCSGSLHWEAVSSLYTWWSLTKTQLIRQQEMEIVIHRPWEGSTEKPSGKWTKSPQLLTCLFFPAALFPRGLPLRDALAQEQDTRHTEHLLPMVSFTVSGRDGWKMPTQGHVPTEDKNEGDLHTQSTLCQVKKTGAGQQREYMTFYIKKGGRTKYVCLFSHLFA